MNMGFHRVLWLALVLVSAVRLHAGPLTFTDLSGRTMSAEILSATDDSIRVRLADERVVTIKLSTLCEDDRVHVKDWKHHNPQAVYTAEDSAPQLVPGVKARTWTSADGSKTFEGRLRAYDAASGEVSVILSNGKGMTFMQDKLSSDDIEWLKENGNAPPPSQANPGRDSLREVSILSFNVLGASLSGPDIGRNQMWGGIAPVWEDRREKVYDVVRKFKPDFIGAQEMEPTQHAEFRKALRQYKHIDGDHWNDILYLDERWRKRDTGTFPIDSGPGDGVKRIVRWAYFYDKHSRNTLYFYSTHFTHKGQTPPPSLLNSSKSLAEHIANKRRHPEAPVIVTGDFNCSVKSDAMRYLVGDFGTTPQKLVYARAGGIDHILLSENHFTFLAKDKVPGRLSGSDHPAVFAKVRVDAWESTGE